jgi:phage/plasmid-associated DNA primase
MNSITIHGLDPYIARRIKEKAKESGTSLNQTIKAMLAQALGMRPAPKGKNRQWLEKYYSLWTEKDLREFQKATEDLGRIEPEEWR